MANNILVLGQSGQGKTTSLLKQEALGIKGLNPKETFLINVAKKPLPTKGWKQYYKEFDKKTKTGNMLSEHDPKIIIEHIRNIPKALPHIKNIVLDDANYMMTYEFMSRASEKSFDKFTDLAKNFFGMLTSGINLPDSIFFIVLAHTEIEEGAYKIKTVGKLVDNQINPIGFFTYTLVSSTAIDATGKTEYGYFTNSTRDNRGIIVPAKTPYGCFEDLIIVNDMGLVVEKIKQYNLVE